MEKRSREKGRRSASGADLPDRKRGAGGGSDVGNLETLVYCALKAFAHDTERLRETLLRIGESAAALPEETLRSRLRSVSDMLDAEFLFLNPWGDADWSFFVPRLSAERASSSEDFEEEDSEFDDGFAKRPAVPWLAFLLAGADFPFTEEEELEIRDADGRIVKRVRRETRGWRKTPETESERGGEFISGKEGGTQ